MQNKHTQADYNALIEIGIPGAETNGYQIVEGDEQALRELYDSQREQGFDVPEEYLPKELTIKEREHRYQEMMMFNLEGERVNRKNENETSFWENMYDFEELSFDEDYNDYVPDWVYNNRREKERRENRFAEKRRIYSKRGKNRESSKKLAVVLNERLERQAQTRRTNIETSKRLVRELQEKNK